MIQDHPKVNSSALMEKAASRRMSALTVAIWGKPDQICSMRDFLRMTDFVAKVADRKAIAPWHRVRALVAARSGEAMALKRLR
jgi:hypothetical protein